MILYAIDIKYTINNGSYQHFFAKRYASSPAQAIAIVSAMFNNLSNWTGSNGQKWISVEAIGLPGTI